MHDPQKKLFPLVHSLLSALTSMAFQFHARTVRSLFRSPFFRNWTTCEWCKRFFWKGTPMGSLISYILFAFSFLIVGVSTNFTKISNVVRENRTNRRNFNNNNSGLVELCRIETFIPLEMCTNGYTSSYVKLVLPELALYDLPVQSTVSLFWFSSLMSTKLVSDWKI